MRKKIYEQELQKEQEAKQRVKDDLMEALVRKKNIYIFLYIITLLFIQLQSDGNVDQVLKRSIEDLEKTRKEEVQPILPNMVFWKQTIV